MNKPTKILDYKTYNSIGHLSTSRLGPTDSYIDRKQESDLTSLLPNQQSVVIVQEKMDGSNVCVVRIDGNLVALTRNGFKCEGSNHDQHRMFHKYVENHKTDFMLLLANDHDRIVGEWCAMAHGTLYERELLEVTRPFIGFDLYRQKRQVGYMEFLEAVGRHRFAIGIPTLIHIGGACSVKRGMKLLKEKSPFKDNEGLIYRLEEAGTIKLIAKHVVEGKEDGKYFKEDQVIWNYEYERP